MSDRKYYVICDSGCRFESMTKEQILAAISQFHETGKFGDCDTGFITTVKTINGTPLKFFVGTQAEYNLLTDSQKENLFAIISNDTSKESLLAAFDELQTAQSDINNALLNITTGAVAIPEAKHAVKAEHAEYAYRLSPFVYWEGSETLSSSAKEFSTFEGEYEPTVWEVVTESHGIHKFYIHQVSNIVYSALGGGGDMKAYISVDGKWNSLLLSANNTISTVKVLKIYQHL